MVLINSSIENISGSGILALGADLEAINLLVDNCGDFLVAHLGGGYENYFHCTLSNSNTDFFRQDPSVVFTDNFQQDGFQLNTDLTLNVVNSILWGNLEEELFISTRPESMSELFIGNSILKTELSLAINDNQINTDPKFIDPIKYNFRLDTLSPAKDAGIDIGVPVDQDGQPRDAQPDIGAYERIEN